MMQTYIQQGNEFDFLTDTIKSFPNGRTLGILFEGPPGVGKTLCALNLAQSFDASYYIIDGSPQLDRRDVEGCWELQNGNTVFNYGPLAMALRDANKEHIAFVIFNEPNAVRPNEQISLNACLSESHINLMSKSSERIALKKNAKLIIIGTMNLAVLGINPLQEAFEQRFMLTLDFDYPNKRKEQEIAMTLCNITQDFATLIVEAAGQFRKAVLEDGKNLSRLFSTRLVVNFAEMIKHTKEKYIKEIVDAMIVDKLAQGIVEKSFVRQMLTGLDFRNRLKELMESDNIEKPHKRRTSKSSRSDKQQTLR